MSPQIGDSEERSAAGKKPQLRLRWTSTRRALVVAAVAAVLAVIGLGIYAATPSFANSVKMRLTAALHRATGGRVEIRGFHWNLWQLAAQVDGLTIHGLEGPNEAPYLQVSRLYVRARILSFLHPSAGLALVEVDHPSFHLIVYPDGTTNQPHPLARKKRSGNTVDTIFNLKVTRAEVRAGMAIIGDRKIPFDVSARNLGVVFTYQPATDHYLGHVDLADLTLQRGGAPEQHSQLSVDLELARNKAEVKDFHLFSGTGKAPFELKGSGAISHFAQPEWRFQTQGSVGLPVAGALAGVQGLEAGVAHLHLDVFGARETGFLATGQVRITGAAYRTPEISVKDFEAEVPLHITSEEVLLDTVHVRLQDGGRVDASLRFLDWRRDMKASIRGRLAGVRLPSVLRIVAKEPFQNLGFDSVLQGKVDVSWTGSPERLVGSAKLQMIAPSRTLPGRLPLRGVIDATYFQREGSIRITNFLGQTPRSGFTASGLLGVYPVTRPSALEIHLNTGDLGEFNQVLTVLGLEAWGKRGAEAIPIQLRGEAEFNGTMTQSLLDPDIGGHLVVRNFSTNYRLPIHWDHLDATGEYSATRIVVKQAQLTSGNSAVEFHGRIDPASEVKTRVTGFRRPEFGDDSKLDVSASIHQASLTDLAVIAGKHSPITGVGDLSVHAQGAIGELAGGGELSIQGGRIFDEPYRTIQANWSFRGHEMNVERLTLRKSAGIVVANGIYDFRSRNFRANLDARDFNLTDFDQLKNERFPLSGSLKFDAHASGTLQAPSILMGFHLTHLTIRNQPAGGLEAFAHTQNGVVSFWAHSTSVAGTANAAASRLLNLTGTLALHDDDPLEAKMELSNLDLGPLLQTFHVEELGGPTVLSGTVQLSGPAMDFRKIRGTGEITRLAVMRENITLTNLDPILASLEGGVVRLTQAHITGPDTNMNLTGTAALTGARPLQLHGTGAVNMKLAQAFDPDITSSGHVDFDVEAGGTLKSPSLTGRVRLTNVGMALSDLSNGISQLNGTLVFDQDRLEVEKLTGRTGGGELKIGGFITYQQGIYADLTASGKDIRVRYSGISATADTKLRLQGSERSLLLNGNVLITRFLIGSNIDFVAFTKPAAPAPPPNRNAPSNHVRLDIHVTSAPQLDFQNSYAQLAGSVDLRIRGTIAQPSLLGKINISEGTANFAGTNYRLQRGSIYFTNPVHIEPIIDIDATTRVEEYDVTVGMHGSAGHLTPTFRSDPPLPQADVISLLALGRTQQEQLVYTQRQEQVGVDNTANMLLGGALNATVGNRVQRLFGFGSVKIDPNYLGNLGTSSARITVQQNISRTVQLTYARNVNATAEQLIQAQFNLTRNVSLLAIRDESDVFSMVIKIHKRMR